MIKTRLFICLLISQITFSLLAQNANLSGVVLDAADDRPLIGASIIVGSRGAASDLNGQFRLQLIPGTYKVTISFVGYRPYEKEITLEDTETLVIRVLLKEESNLLNTATVTSGKFSKPLSEVTVSLDVLPTQLISNSNQNQLDDALQKIPGFQLIDGQANVRGGSGFSYGAGSRVLLLKDDIPILTADAGFPNWSDIPMENTGQVEVVKGAASALYGSAALNGIVNFRTAFAGELPETNISLFGTTYFAPQDESAKWWDTAPLTGGGSLTHKQKFGKLDVVGSLFYINENTHNEDTYSRYGRLNLNTRYRLTDRINFGINANLNKGKNADFFYWKNDEEYFSGAENSSNKSDYLRFSVDPHLTIYDAYNNRHQLKSRYLRIDNDVSAERANSADQYYLEYQYQRSVKAWDVVFTAGGVASGSKVRAELYGDTTFTSRNLAAYLQMDKQFGDRLHASLGLRYEDNLLENPGFQYERGTVPAKDEQEARPVLRLGLNYQLADFTYLRSSFGQGYRFPSIAEKFIFTDIGGLFISPNPELESETGWSAEIGLKQGLKISGLESFLDVAFFWSRYQDMMEFNFVSFQDGFQSRNIGDTEIKGLEVSLFGQGELWGKTTRIIGGYLYVDPRFLDYDNVAPSPFETPTQAQLNALNSSSDSDILKYRSQHSFKLDAESDFNKWSVGAAIRYNSHMEAIDNALFLVVPGLADFREENDNGFTVVDVRTAFRFTEQMRASLLLNNIFNTKYATRPGLMDAPRNLSLRLDINL